MFYYIIRDLTSALYFLPYGIVVGIFAMLFWCAVNDARKKRGRATFPVMAYTLLVMYVAIVIGITFLSRESGSGQEPDLQIFSTWGINNRNNAYVLENVLLFIPLGIICPVAFRKFRHFLISVSAGFFASLLIELLQLISRRGFFQIDDIITNTIGMIIGFGIFKLCSEIRAHCTEGIFFKS